MVEGLVRQPIRTSAGSTGRVRELRGSGGGRAVRIGYNERQIIVFNAAHVRGGVRGEVEAALGGEGGVGEHARSVATGAIELSEDETVGGITRDESRGIRRVVARGEGERAIERGIGHVVGAVRSAPSRLHRTRTCSTPIAQWIRC